MGVAGRGAGPGRRRFRHQGNQLGESRSRRVLIMALTCRSRWPTYLTWMRSSSLVPPCRLVLHEGGGGVGEAQLRETALVAKQLGVDPKVLHRRAQIAMLSGLARGDAVYDVVEALAPNHV